MLKMKYKFLTDYPIKLIGKLSRSFLDSSQIVDENHQLEFNKLLDMGIIESGCALKKRSLFVRTYLTGFGGRLAECLDM